VPENVAPTISLLHATWHHQEGVESVRDRWLSAADRPDLVEFIVGMDADDAGAVEATVGRRRFIGAASDPGPTAVRNWNGAAMLARGHLLFVISDHLRPRQGWDTHLRSAILGRDAETEAFAVCIRNTQSRFSEMPRGSLQYPWLAHPVISRAFMRRHGLFDPRFHGVGCDIDIAIRAYWKAFIIDARATCIVDDRPSILGPNASQAVIHAPEEQLLAKDTLRAKWRTWQRVGTLRFVKPAKGRGLSAGALRVRVLLGRAMTVCGLPYVLGRRWIGICLRSVCESRDPSPASKALRAISSHIRGSIE
jgi:hypothetical protein